MSLTLWFLSNSILITFSSEKHFHHALHRAIITLRVPRYPNDFPRDFQLYLEHHLFLSLSTLLRTIPKTPLALPYCQTTTLPFPSREPFSLSLSYQCLLFPYSPTLFTLRFLIRPYKSLPFFINESPSITESPFIGRGNDKISAYFGPLSLVSQFSCTNMS